MVRPRRGDRPYPPLELHLHTVSDRASASDTLTTQTRYSFDSSRAHTQKKNCPRSSGIHIYVLVNSNHNNNSAQRDKWLCNCAWTARTRTHTHTHTCDGARLGLPIETACANARSREPVSDARGFYDQYDQSGVRACVCRPHGISIGIHSDADCRPVRHLVTRMHQQLILLRTLCRS